ncbi:unnamed protein product [Vitrella brassicaformis CCMP3155]|uniref:Uncharacterized protein n=1 Tax=Vitrella brassicaformis (strain CCMP3155) TaxID=1169540 RepID=A0A0G4FY46_VITBC|nr:unnamed protein product [Vitrella brassicaformis CCMP3155]|eukprot:CEM20263.1 unnamed protein product [Vitrella brassicaformis CCMP3155]
MCSAVLPVVPLLPSAIQTAFRNALKEAVDDQNDDEEAFDYLYKQFIDRETRRIKKEAAERHRLEAENERLREEIATLKSQECRGADGQGEHYPNASLMRRDGATPVCMDFEDFQRLARDGVCPPPLIRQPIIAREAGQEEQPH